MQSEFLETRFGASVAVPPYDVSVFVAFAYFESGRHFNLSVVMLSQHYITRFVLYQFRIKKDPDVLGPLSRQQLSLRSLFLVEHANTDDDARFSVPNVSVRIASNRLENRADRDARLQNTDHQGLENSRTRLKLNRTT